MAKRPAPGYASGGKRAPGPHQRARKRKGGPGIEGWPVGTPATAAVLISVHSPSTLSPLSVHSPSTLLPLSVLFRSHLVRTSFGCFPKKLRTRSGQGPNERRTRVYRVRNKAITRSLRVNSSQINPHHLSLLKNLKYIMSAFEAPKNQLSLIKPNHNHGQ